MPGRRIRVFSRQFKESAVRRILTGEKIRTVAAELRVRPQLLYTWRDYYEQGGPMRWYHEGGRRKRSRRPAVGHSFRNRVRKRAGIDTPAVRRGTRG